MTQPKDKSTEIYHKKLSEILIHNFFAGIMWGLGVTIGAAIVLAFGGFILSKINLIPFIGEYVKEIAEYVQDASPRL